MRVTLPVTISSSTCLEQTGCSWKSLLRLCKAHNVPVWRLNSRPVVSGPLAYELLERVNAGRSDGDFATALDAAERKLAAKVKKFPTKP